MDAKDLSTAVASETNRRLETSVRKIRHCIDQLSDDQLWWRPAEPMNSIGNLVLHLSGNLRQWIVAGVGGAIDNRNRPEEFSERGPIARDDLLALLDLAVNDSREALDGITAESLLRPLRIQGFELTALGAIFDSIPHFGGHTQEIVNLTRQQLGDSYRFEWAPSTAEGGE
ncbi:MAG TPA: hypothetical protein DCE43_07185 [Planctomycetaceae bacterium]|nr:hypothetical protein [Planctomycetaceae bacterium]|tara:strand:+ start:2697 stop:3209 length:513 start_codon:yes stop_codon:yes gene_type:complete